MEGEPAGIIVNVVGPAAFTWMQDDVLTDEQFRQYARPRAANWWSHWWFCSHIVGCVSLR